MEEVRQLVQEEGREARNLVAFHVAVDSPARISRKPPRSIIPPVRRVAPRAASRRSASAGRDKRSELRARYWALLFGDLQRAIGEIYHTVEAHESLNECQEVILVLENYTRDFKALGEWFRLKWEYDNTPPPQRPQSLAWEIRKTDFVRPESRRTLSVKSSPSVSGKNSPSLSGHNTPSGKNSPNLTGKASPGSGKISPRVSSGHSSTSPKANIEFFSNKLTSKITAKPEPKAVKEPRLSDIKEKDVKDSPEESEAAKEILKSKDLNVKEDKHDVKPLPVVEIGKAKECSNISPKQVIIKSSNNDKMTKKCANKTSSPEISPQAKAIIDKLDVMESEFLTKHLTENEAKNENLLNQEKSEEMSPKMDKPNEQEFGPCNEKNEDNQEDKTLKEKGESVESLSTESPTKSEDNFADVSNDSSPKSNDEIGNAEITKETVEDKALHDENKLCKENVANLPETEENKEVVPRVVNEVKDDSKKELKPSPRPAYSQAAAKPKSSVASKTESRTQTKSTTPLYRSKTVVEMQPKTVPKTQKQFPKRNQMSKCSYPFNLTTGRKSLFDTNPSSCRGATPKKTVNRNIQMASGDSKPNQSRNDPKKRPSRPTSLKVNEDGKKSDKLNTSLEKIKDYEEYSSSDTIVPQIDRSRIESSESLKTLVPEDMQMAQEVSNSIEVLNVDNDKNDNDGWLTVKSRRLSRESKKQLKSHWANRFHQPSATTSLPTLNMIESPKQETKSIVISPIDAKTEITESVQRPEIEKKQEEVTVSEKKNIEQPKCEAKSKDPAMIRQKSDVTGLKTRPSRSRALRKERLKGAMKDDNVSELTKNRLHSSLESLTTTGLERSQESTEEAFDFDKWKAEFKNTFKYLDEDDQMSNHNEILKTADPSEMSEIAEMTSQIEENEKKLSWALDFQSEVDQRKLCEEEEILTRQILELQQVSDIDLDTETDDTETDAEILCEDAPVPPGSQENLDLTASLEDQYETALAGMSWAERMDTLFVLEELVARDPGRAQQLHAKLSQGIRRRGSLQDALRRLQAKQARAERQRLEYQMQRTKKIHQLLARVEEVKIAKYQLIEEKKLRMERRLQKAAENRDQHLKGIVRKAHDEEEKLREIAFIKQLEAENRRHEFLDQCRSHTTRLRLVRRDRLQKLEQKAAREAAVGARRQALEEARRLHVETLVERRRERDARAEELKELKRQERDDAARERAQGVRSRLSALAAAAELEAEALRSRIQDKQDASQQRLDRHLQAIRERATGPRPPTISESQEQATREQEEEAVKQEQEKKERERQKNIKKKARKVRLKLMSTCKEDLLTNRHALAQTPNTQTSKITKLVQQIMNTLATVVESDAKDDRVEINMNEFEFDLEERGGKKGKGKKKNGNDNDSKKSKKKNNGNNDKQKMAKTESVCSSLSDMSKSSTNADWKPRPMFDSVLLERQLNEMNRTISKLDKSYTSWRIHALNPTTKLLSLIVDRDGAAPIFSTRCITTCVMLACRSISEITTWQILTTEAFVHMLKLYADLVEVDFESDPRERELVRFLIDHMCFAFDSLVRLSRNYLNPQFPPEVVDVLAYLRNRAFTVMSYLCLSGAITRGVSSFDLHDATIILLTAFTELFQPCDLDTGPERPSAIQSIKNTLGTDLGGCRAELCDMFARGAGVKENYQFMSAVRTVRFLRMWAEIDYQFVQDAFGEGKWPLEFRAAVARLLTQHATNVVEEARPNTGKKLTKREEMDQALSETMVLDLIILVGFVLVNNPQMQDTILDGWSVIKTLCNLPANWLVMTPHNEALLPTLVVLCERASTAKAIASEINMNMLESYVNEPTNQKIKLVQVIKQCRSKKTKK